MDGWQCLDEFILPPSWFLQKHISWTTSVGTWLPSAEHQAGELRVNKMEAQTWSIHMRNYMVTSSFYDDQYKELFFDLSICVIFCTMFCVIMYKKNPIYFCSPLLVSWLFCVFSVKRISQWEEPTLSPLAKTSRLVAPGRTWSDDLFLNSMQYDSIVCEETKIYH